MNIYGDTGNVLTLTRRCQWRGIDYQLINYNPGDPWPAHADLIVGGGGQDSGQSVIQRDLPRIAEPLCAAIDGGAAALAICGTYQLFGNYFEPIDGSRIDGLGILDAHTVAGEERLIGNIVTQSSEFGSLVGYENHSGRTYLGSNLSPLAQVKKGAGNNGEDGFEGARYRNVIATYLHGPLLPKNPALADQLITWGLEHAGVICRIDTMSPTNEHSSPLQQADSWAQKAARIAADRPR
jgi:CobQ-like glutamine amidotransferase family enzyme